MPKHLGWDCVRPLQGQGEGTPALETFGSAQASGSVAVLLHRPLSQADSGFTDTFPHLEGSPSGPWCTHRTTFLLERDSVLLVWESDVTGFKTCTSQPAVWSWSQQPALLLGKSDLSNG